MAALALLGAAAAVASNPVLMTLAVLSSGRKRRDINMEKIGRDDLTPELQSKLEEMQVITFLIIVYELVASLIFLNFRLWRNTLSRFPSKRNNKRNLWPLTSLALVSPNPATRVWTESFVTTPFDLAK